MSGGPGNDFLNFSQANGYRAASQPPGIYPHPWNSSPNNFTANRNTNPIAFPANAPAPDWQSRTASLEATVRSQSKILEELNVKISRLIGVLESKDKDPAKKGSKLPPIHTFVPKLKINLKTTADVARIDIHDREDLMKIFSSMGAPFDCIDAYELSKTRHRLDLYTLNMDAWKLLIEPERSTDIVSHLALDSQSSVETETYWVEVNHTEFDTTILKDHATHKEAWKKSTGLAIHETQYTCAKLLWGFKTLAAALKACSITFIFSAAVGRARPFDKRSLPFFCYTCGRPGHASKECGLKPKYLIPSTHHSSAPLCIHCSRKHPRVAGGFCKATVKQCLNCGGKHSTEDATCLDPDVLKHRSECSEVGRRETWWASNVNLPLIPEMVPRQLEQKEKSKAKSTKRRTNPKRSINPASAPGAFLNLASVNETTPQQDTAVDVTPNDPTSPITVNEDTSSESDSPPVHPLFADTKAKADTWKARKRARTPEKQQTTIRAMEEAGSPSKKVRTRNDDADREGNHAQESDDDQESHEAQADDDWESEENSDG